MKEERGDCVMKQGELARVSSVATAVAPCAASFVAPRHRHRRRTSVSHWLRELLSSHHKQDPMQRERQNDARRERRRCGMVYAAATLFVIAICGALRCRSHELRINPLQLWAVMVDTL